MKLNDDLKQWAEEMDRAADVVAEHSKEDGTDYAEIVEGNRKAASILRQARERIDTLEAECSRLTALKIDCEAIAKERDDMEAECERLTSERDDAETRAERLRADRAAILLVKAKDSDLTISEWMARTADAERLKREARAECERLRVLLVRAASLLPDDMAVRLDIDAALNSGGGS